MAGRPAAAPLAGALEERSLRAAGDAVAAGAASREGMSDEQARPMIDALGEESAVALALALAIFDGFGRFCRMLEIEPEDR